MPSPQPAGYTRALIDRLRELEARQDELTERFSSAATDIPVIHPNVAVFYGDLGTIIEWTAAKDRRGRRNRTDTPVSGVSVSVVAGAGFEPATFRL
ncbi:hypothetical protein [Candidatus Rariloculus sp.]|uniref:hypothetical protein n=1 Tax=Candidatus Rariloculus sp. TaxID=3101265 RepID=UPI003D13A288